jgi:DNA-binding XRE family transcriptional regulator
MSPISNPNRSDAASTLLCCVRIGNILIQYWCQEVHVKTPRLRIVRDSRTLSQSELAELANVAKGTIVRLEGGGEAQPRTVRKLAAALQVDALELRGQTQ